MLRMLTLTLAAALLVNVGGLAAQADQPAGHRFDWFHGASLTASPYQTNAAALADGNLETISGPMGGPQIGGWIAIDFPQAMAVTSLRFMQYTNQAANSFDIQADLTGDGNWQSIAKLESDSPIVNEWIVVPIDRTVHGIRIQALSGGVGYRTGFPNYRQIEIYTAEPVVVEAPAPVTGLPRLQAAGASRPADISSTDIPFTPCIDLWMMGIHGGPEMPETTEEILASEGFQNLVRRVQAMGGQGVRMFLETPAVNNYLPWTSELARHYDRDTLRGIMGALHTEGMTGSIFLHVWMAPFQDTELMLPMPDRRWDYPYEQSSIVAAKGLYEGYESDRYPCVLTGGHFKEMWLGVLREAVERGLDGVYAIPDEYYFKGHDLDTFTCPTSVVAFRERFGYDTLPELGPGRTGHFSTPGVANDPRRVADTEHYRKWVLFQYEKLAELFNDVAGELKAMNPDLVLVSSANPGSTYYSNRRLEHGLAFDIIGQGENFNAVQLYASVPVGLGPMGRHTALARRMRGSHPNAELVSSIQSLNFNTRDPNGNEIMFWGYVLPHVMNGASRIDLYRLNYVEGPWLPVIRRGIDMVRVLESWGILESESDARVAVLLSRASEDWWLVRAQALLGLTDDPNADLAAVGGAPLLHFEDQIGTVTTMAPAEAERVLDLERFRGAYAGQVTESILLENGIQYDMFYADQAQLLGNLDQYDVVMLPFSYSMSLETFAQIKAATESGTRILIFDQLAPTDEYGNPHPQPLLEALVALPNVTFVDMNLAIEGVNRATRASVRDMVRDAMDGGGFFDAGGVQVEFLSRRTSDGMILYLANWDRTRKAQPVLGLDLPAGDYTMEVVRGGQGQPVIETMQLNGQTTASAADLASFSLEMEPGEVMLVRVARP